MSTEDIVNGLKENIREMQESFEEEIRKLKSSQREKINSVEQAMRSVCEHPVKRLKDKSWDHPHNGDEVEHYECTLCGQILSRAEYLKLSDKKE